MTQDYLQDIQEIRSIMEERSRFLSLSGLSGILAGIYALVGAYVGYNFAVNAASVPYTDIKNGELTPVVMKLLSIAGVILLLSLATAYFFTSRKAKRRNEAMWTPATKRALVSFLVPLVTGGIFCLLLLWRGHILLLSPCTLIFYGLALYSASRYTLRDVGALGILEIILGLTSMLFPGKGIYFWAIGFGVLHIFYGIIMYYKYDRHDNKTDSIT